MKPFILEKHATEYPTIRELQQEERELATGGCECRIITIVLTPDGDFDEECGER
jgi:hypothetical protein